MKKLFALFSVALILSGTPEFNLAKPFLDKIEKEYGIYAKQRAVALVQMMNEARGLDEISKLEKVNDFFNQTPYASDKSIWGTSDYWATRLEFIGKDKGDCEDFVIAKFFTLKELGVPSSKLYMTYAKSLRYNAAHLVLTYYETPKSTPLVLDNYNYKIFPATQRRDLIPIYSFRGDELLKAKQAQIGKIISAATRQERQWDELVITQRKE